MVSFEDFEYPNVPQPKRSQSGCLARLLPILIMFMLAYWVSQRFAQPDPRQPNRPIPQEVERSGPSESSIGLPTDSGQTSEARRADADDWSIEEVETSPSVDSSPKVTEKGDWVIEEVDSNSKISNDAQVDINDPKSTREGDWEIEEVESGKPD